MATLDEQEANQIANIEKASGRSLDEWINLIRAAGPDKHAQIIAWLKAEHSLTYGNANLLAIKARQAAAGGAASDAELIASHYAGKNAALEPLYSAVIDKINGLGSDVEIDPKKSYVSLRRKKQFATVGPAAGTLEIGVNLPGLAPTTRLRETTGMCTHRVRIDDAAGLDAELIGWLEQAYARAG